MARVHYGWVVAGAAFATLVAAAAFRAAPGPLMVPLHEELGWSIVTMSAAVSVNLVLYGLTAPFAAALMERFGLRRVTAVGLLMIAAGAGLSVFAQAAWQLVFTWGILIGLGTGSMALVFAATVANAWFVKRRGLVMGILTAGGAAGQLVFLPLVAFLAEATSWKAASLLIAAAALAVIPVAALLLRDRPFDIGLPPYGADELVPPPPPTGRSVAGLALGALREAAGTRAFWALAGAFAICGATTNGLIGIHFIPSAHDHGMATTTAAGLLMVVGIFDIVGTVASGWLTDRIDPRTLLLVYYTFRGVGLVLLPWLLADSVHPSMVLFIVVYGLDWVATVPPTVALCRRIFGARGTIVFGWVFASHQLGAAAAALGRRHHPGHVRHLHLRVVRRGGAVRHRGRAVHQPAPPAAHRRRPGSTGTRTPRPRPPPISRPEPRTSTKEDAMPLRSDWSSEQCPIARSLEVLGDPWVLLVLRQAFSGVRRFDQLRSELKIADNVLSSGWPGWSTRVCCAECPIKIISAPGTSTSSPTPARTPSRSSPRWPSGVSDSDPTPTTTCEWTSCTARAVSSRRPPTCAATAASV